jgi:alginate O-acetyltransferase complex protein AlgI
VFALQPNSISTGLAWIGILAYSMQIYYDFAGYSDMAIGLARMFGFELLENFNFPYIAKSIKEFWRRWHISLSNWFRDYLYISLGGNRLGNRRTIINLFIVFFVTGFWHGASWNFLIWGLLHGLFLVLERTKFGEMLKRLPSFMQSGYTIFIAVMAWVLFRAETLTYATRFYESLFGLNSADLNYFVFLKVVTRESVFIFFIAVLGALGGFQKCYDWVSGYVQNSNLKIQYSISVIKHVAVIIFLAVVLLYGTGSLVLGAYNPFIYFRF